MSLLARIALPSLLAFSSAEAAPPFPGAAFIDPDVITGTDPTTFTGLAADGIQQRVMFDRRIDGFATYSAYIFAASFTDTLNVEFAINTEFGDQTDARGLAEFYAPIIGRMPRSLRLALEEVWIQPGDHPFGGNPGHLLIHTGSFAQEYIGLGFLEEVLVHEASHTSLDAQFAADPAWLAAGQADGEYISDYARDNPAREDVAESFNAFLAVACRRAELDRGVGDIIENAMPNRFAFLAAQGLELTPLPCDGETSSLFRNGFESVVP